MNPLAGRVAIVTGASRGVGKAISSRLVREGARVAMVARHHEPLQEAASEARAAGGEAMAIPCDVSDESSVRRMVEVALEQFGFVDVLVNNAGIALNGPVDSYPLSDWQQTLATNLTGAFLCSRAVLPPMRRRGQGHIIAIASGAAKTGYPQMAAYCASKFGLLGFMQALAAELSDSGIKVSTICPGSILTDFGSRPASAKLLGEAKYLKPEDVAEAVVYLLQQPGRAWTQEMNLWPF